MSYRRLWVLVNRLPQESWTQTILRDNAVDSDLVAPVAEERFGPWALTNYQLALLADHLAFLRYELLAVNGSKQDAPSPTPTPARKRPRRVPLSREAVAYLNRLRAPKAG